MTTLAQLTGADAAAVGTLATANGAAKTDLSNTTATQLAFGGATSAYPALIRNAANMDLKLADGSAWTGITVSWFTALSFMRSYPTTVSGLPAAATVGAGSRAFVTDANATTFNSVVAGSGSNGVPVFSDGTNWRIG